MCTHSLSNCVASWLFAASKALLLLLGLSAEMVTFGMLQAVRVGLAVSASFLNNSSSRWEAICESWAVEAEMVDTVSPIYRSDHHRCVVLFLFQ